MAEIRIPDDAVAIHHHVMRLRVFTRQIVFGDDDTGRAAGEPRKRLQWKFHRLGIAQIHAGQIVGHLLLDRPRHRRAIRIVAAGEQRLRMGWRRTRRIGAHALEHLHELGGVMGRLHDALDGVAADAIGQRGFEFVVAGQAVEPFAVGELVGQRVGFRQRDVGGGRGARRNIGRFRAIEPIADGASRDAVMAGCELVCGEAVNPLRVRHHAGRNITAVKLGADQHAFHDRLLRRGDFAGEGCAALRLRGGGEQKTGEAARRLQQFFRQQQTF